MKASDATSMYILSPPNENVCQSQLISLNAAAQEGNIDALYSVLQENPFILETIDRIPFTDTPLHTAVRHGQTSFVKEIAKLKPSFARKLNQYGFSPLHLASENDNVEIVKELVKLDKNLCLLRGKENMTPLHHAAMEGNMDVLKELLSVCPDCIEELTVRHETVLHLAVKYRKLEALKFLVEELSRLHKQKLMDWKDNEEKNVMELSRESQQLQMLEMLPSALSSSATKWKNRFLDCFRVSKNERDAILVVAVLIAAAAFQVGVNPPGGLWQDNDIPSANNNTVTASSDKPHIAGTSVLASRSKFVYFILLCYNTTTFLISLLVIHVNTPGLTVIHVGITNLWVAYSISVAFVWPMGSKDELTRPETLVIVALVIYIPVYIFSCISTLPTYTKKLRSFLEIIYSVAGGVKEES